MVGFAIVSPCTKHQSKHESPPCSTGSFDAVLGVFGGVDGDVLCENGSDHLSLEKPAFRIIAPEFICNPKTRPIEDGVPGGNFTNPVRQLTIGFQTNGGQHLQYRVRTYFTLLDEKGFISQRHTVGLWRAVRQLEQRLRRDRETIAQSGQMTVGTDELLPGVMYTLGVVGVASDGTETEEQNFTMTYRNADQGASYEHGGSMRTDDDVSLLLLGAEVSYVDVEYRVSAELIFCRPRVDYFFRWSLEGFNGSDPILAVVMERSKTLRVPANSLAAGHTYAIQVVVYSTSVEDEVLAKARMQVTVLHRHPQVVLFPVDAVVGVSQPVRIRSYVLGGEIVWSCRKEGVEQTCEDTIDISEETAMVFYREGQYEITASVGGDGSNRSVCRSTLTVHPKVTPSVRVLEWSRYPAVAGEQFELLVSIAGLVPDCSSNWTVVREDGFAYFDPATLPNAANWEGFVIRDIEENFLSELVDYGNDTVVRDVVLSIPGADLAASWKGLEPNVRYKIRLQTICPEPIDDSKVASQRATVRNLISSHATFVLETNGAPQLMSIEVTPMEGGMALETMYKMSTAIANDLEGDYPLRYSFWYVADGVDINVGTYYEITSAETILPYTKNGSVATYCIICDSRDACSKTIGPEVRVLSGRTRSENDITFALQSIDGFFDRLNLREALKTAFELLITLRNQNSPQYGSTYEQFATMLKRSIEHIGKVYRETTYLTDASIQEFVIQAKPILDLEEATNHVLFQQLLELMDPIAEQHVARLKRSSHSAAGQPVTQIATNTNTKLSLMESLTVSENATVARDARTRLQNFVHQATKNYCSVETHYVYVGQLITLEMSRYRSVAEIDFRRLQVPNKVLLSSPAGRSQFADAFTETEYICLGRIYYARDLFVERDTRELDLGFYEAFLLAVEKSGIWTLVNWRSDYFLWSLDGRQLPNVTCQLWEGDVWSSRHCITLETATDEVQCNCTKIAYLRISNETEPDYNRTNTVLVSTEATAVSFEMVSESFPSSTNPTTSTKSTDGVEHIATVPTTGLWSTTDSPAMSDVVSTTESDMVTLSSASTVNTEPPAESFPIASTSNTSVPDNGPSALLQGGNRTGSTSLYNQPLASSSIGYAITSAVGIGALLMLVIAIAYRRRKSVLRLADELHTVPLRARAQSSPHVRYARFQDEHNMAGDNVSTISDILTT
ncbi:uncharacterized protein LOC128721217 [Anopheles nili]|uniref:uncharacterized protein LOC128721217 n=1 Tax=Anopheles nili TaxID=185578 RepID=UPI00237BBCFF|nr:uncharacterized protein LOC128721217 [Anopheles nili]